MKWMLTCKETSQLLSDAKDKNLPLVNRLLLGMHILMCHQCRTYKRQLNILFQAFKKMGQSIENDSNIHLSESIKQSLKKEIEKRSES
jgi:hypothetical protein